MDGPLVVNLALLDELLLFDGLFLHLCQANDTGHEFADGVSGEVMVGVGGVASMCVLRLVGS